MKFTLLFTTLIAAAAAAPAPEAAAAPAEAGDVSILATKKWTASGGCKTDWSGRCNAQCIGEAKQKGYKCKDVDSDITGSNCFVGWSTCKCTCFT